MDYSKYKFNYFDVVKRHERIINRPKDWEIKALAIIILMVTFIYTFTSFGFCSEVEQVEFDSVPKIRIYSNYNYFVQDLTTNGIGVGYFPIESGYIYYIKNNHNFARQLAVSSNIPALNVTYNYIGELEPGETYSYIGSSGYLYFDFSSYQNISVSREKMSSQGVAVSELVDNVGINQIWGVFESGISFVGVVVLVAFGLFLVVLAIKKVSKGKSEF